MSLEQIVENLKKEINARNRNEVIENLEKILSENVNELSILKISFTYHSITFFLSFQK